MSKIGFKGRRRNGQNTLTTKALQHGSWIGAPFPDFTLFAAKIVGRWQGWQAPWLSPGVPCSGNGANMIEIATDVLEIFRRCGSVTGIEDSGRRDIADPGFVYFNCGSWMEGPKGGILGPTSCLTSVLTFGQSATHRRSIRVEMRRNRIERVLVSLEFRGKAHGIPTSESVHKMRCGSICDASAWPGSTWRATSSGGPGGSAWSSLRVSWHTCQAVKSRIEASDVMQLPLGCFVATRTLATGGLDVILGAMDGDESDLQIATTIDPSAGFGAKSDLLSEV